MASSSSVPASSTQSKKPRDKTADWFRQALLKKPKKMPLLPLLGASQEGPVEDAPHHHQGNQEEDGDSPRRAEGAGDSPRKATRKSEIGVVKRL